MLKHGLKYKNQQLRSLKASKAALARWANNPPTERRHRTFQNGKAGLLQLIQIVGLVPEAEFKFHPSRRWRFDFAFPSQRIAVEYEGIFSVKSRHTSIKGFKGDCDKYNEAQKLGWSVFRLTAMHINTGEALELLGWISSRLKGE